MRRALDVLHLKARSSDTDHSLKGVTVPTFLDTLREAVGHLDAVQPEALREPLALWFRATEAQVISEGWTHLLGRSVVAVWNAARAVHGQADDEQRGTRDGGCTVTTTDPAALLRLAAKGRRAYAEHAPDNTKDILLLEANTFESAAKLIEDPTRIGLLIPTSMER